MKCLRLTVFLFFILFLSGCSIKYNLLVTENYIDERINAVFENTPDNLKIAEEDEYPLHYNDKVLYGKKLNIKGKNILLELHYRYSFLDFRDADSYNIPFSYRDVTYKNNILTIDLRNLSNFSTNVNFDIRIKTDKKVLNHNADAVKGNVYIWHVKYSERNKLKVNIKIKTNETSKKIILKKIILYTTVSISLICVIGFVCFIAFNRYKKSIEV